MSGLDEAVYANLSDLKQRLERGENSMPFPSSTLAQLAEIKLRLAKIEESGVLDAGKNDKDKERKSNETTAIALMVAREDKLNAEEKTLFAELLHKEYFTNKDAKKFNEFYENSYGKLSEEGKKAFDDRVIRGVQLGELDPDNIAKPLLKEIKEKYPDSLSVKKDSLQPSVRSAEAATPPDEEKIRLTDSEASIFEGFGLRPTEIAQKSSSSDPSRGFN